MHTNLVSALVAQAGPARAVLHLFGGPYAIICGERVEVPEGSKKLLAFVALCDGRVERRQAAGTLWPDGEDLRAAGNLRSALWRLKGAGIDLLVVDKHGLHLCPDVVVDVRLIWDWSSRLFDGTMSNDDLVPVAWRKDALDLLPGWYDDWALFERERVRQRMLHALESLSRHLARLGRGPEAVDAGMTVVGMDPFRESARRVLIEAHLAEGNYVEACRAFSSYDHLLRTELGVEPGEGLVQLMRRTRVTSPAQPSAVSAALATSSAFRP